MRDLEHRRFPDLPWIDGLIFYQSKENLLYRVLIDGLEAPLIVELPDQENPEVIFDPETNYGDALMTIVYHVFFHKTVSSGRGLISFLPYPSLEFLLCCSTSLCASLIHQSEVMDGTGLVS